jgi:hypothetical protein
MEGAPASPANAADRIVPDPDGAPIGRLAEAFRRPLDDI